MDLTTYVNLPRTTPVVMIVDDESTNLRLLNLLLKSEGYAVLESQGGEDALVKCREHQPDLVLLDLLMPVLNGHQVAALIKQDSLTRHIPIIMITSVDDRETRLKALKVGVEDFLTKPIDRQELMARVKNMLRLKAHQDLLRAHNATLAQQVDAGTQTVLRQQGDIARLTRIYAVLSGINSAIVRMHDQQQLLDEACRIAVSHGAFLSAWIGLIDDKTQKGKIVAHSGTDGVYVDQVELDASPDAPLANRPANIALREARSVICQDIAALPAFDDVRDELLARSHRSMAAFPLIVHGKSMGVLSLFADQVGFFDEQEIKLLNELAGDIAFGLQYIEKEKQLNYIAFYDPLTGLANRTFYTEQLTRTLTRARQSSRRVAVIFGDVARFRMVNETYGRNAGDEVLAQIAARLTGMSQNPDALARIGSACFASFIEHVDDLTEVAHQIEQVINETVNEPFMVQGEPVSLALNAGIAVYPNDGQSTEEIFNNAEAAMKRAKATGQSYLFYQPSINTQVASSLKMESQLRKAVRNQEFVLHYQPKIDTRSRKLVGLEALVRWNHPENGLMYPSRFISLLEETGLIIPVGKWAIQQSLKDYAELARRGLQPPRIAVNASLHQIRHDNFATTVRQALDASGVAPQALEIEITESLFMHDADENSRMLESIRSQGVTIAIDDFGTGYSSLSYLSKLPVDALKIDKSFIQNMTDDADNMAIVSSVISLAHALNISVVAEGVEFEEQAKFLRLLKCDEMQGYFFSMPLAFDELEAYMRAQIN